jgi:hypothetical protein
VVGRRASGRTTKVDQGRPGRSATSRGRRLQVARLHAAGRIVHDAGAGP